MIIFADYSISPMEAEHPLIKKKVNLFDGINMVSGAMIGSGIFIVSADIARNLGSPGWLIMVWVITGVLTLIGAVCYGELASMMPRVGGQYVYLRESYHPIIGFLFGWTTFLVIQCGSIAAVGIAFAKFSGVIFPWIADSNLLFELGPIKVTSTVIVAIGLIILLTWLNIQGIVVGKKVQNIFSSTKVLALVGFVIVGLIVMKSLDSWEINKEVFWSASQTGSDGAKLPLKGFSLITAVGISLVGALFSADAWYDVTFISGEVINPRKNVPLSLLIGTFIVSVLYIIVNYIFIAVLPLHGSPDGADTFSRGIQYATDDRVATSVMEVALGDPAAVIMALLIMISTFGCNHGLILAGPRVYYAMAADGLFFKRVGKINKNGVPSFAMIIQGIWSILLCLSGTYSDLLDYVIFAVLLFFTLTILAIFILRKKRPDEPRPYRAFGYPFVPALYILITTAIMVILLIYKPNYTFPGLFIVFLGVPVYFLWKKFSKEKSVSADKRD